MPSPPAIVLVLLSYGFRVPALLNARSTNSDAAVVGLQAIHFLKGEYSPFLWGSGYQTSADVAVAAGFFAVLGASPLTLMLSSLTLHVLATYLVFAVLRRHFADATALVLSLPLVFAPSSIHSYALYPPRQLAITLAMASFWAIERAGTPSRPDLFSDSSTRPGRGSQVYLLVAGLLSTLAVSADPYPMVLLPVSAAFAAMVAWPRKRRVALWMAGALVGSAPFVALHSTPRGNEGPMSLTPSVFAHNTDLLLRECLPWALSYKVYYAQNVMDYVPWQAPLPIRVVQVAGAAILALLVLGGLAAPFVKRLPWAVRRLGFVGALTFPVTIGAFVLSVMVMDHFSMRYLATLTLMTPFAAAPIARLLGSIRFGVAFAPVVLASAIGGWVGYGPFVRDLLVPVVETPELADDFELREFLRANHVKFATADYWASYRLTLLYGEEIVVVPKNASEDRYPPYRRGFEEATRYAYVFDPGRSRENLDVVTRELQPGPGIARVGKFRTGRLTVFLVDRP